jgi:hypothetical protein
MRKIYLSVIAILLSCFICCSINKKLQIDQVEKNPIEYIFHFSKDEIENAIVKSFDLKHGGRPFYEEETVFYGEKEYKNFLFQLWNPNIINHFETVDTLFYILTESRSKVYYQRNGYPYTYSPWRYIFHIDSIEENLTKVWIEVVEPKVPIRPPLIELPHTSWTYKEVPSTTVEEYEILQALGSTLGGNDMPTIKIPQRIVF